MNLIFIDPSGNFNEGKGHTGIACIENYDWSTLKTKSLSAAHYTSRHQYWDAMISKVLDFRKTADDIVVIESFMIRTNGFLIGKMPETIQFIGALCWELEQYGVKYTLQTPTQAKARFKDEKLPDYIEGLEHHDNGRYYLNGIQINEHIRDALKHMLYYIKYGEK